MMCRARRASPGWRSLHLLLFVMSSLLVAIGTAAAQDPDGQGSVLITGRDLALAGAATAGDAVLSRADVPIARLFGDSAFHARHPGFNTAAKRASLATETVLMITGGTIWEIARIRHDHATEDVAFHTTESVASAAIFIQVVRGVLGRARPFVVDTSGERRDADPYDFELLHGFTSFNYRSFPSMHAMASFAVASALAQEMRVRNTPHRQVLSPLLYVGASMPALARMYLDEHWASDIAMGVFLGVLSGQKAVLFSHAHPGNRVDRLFLKPSLHIGVTTTPNGLSPLVSLF